MSCVKFLGDFLSLVFQVFCFFLQVFRVFLTEYLRWNHILHPLWTCVNGWRDLEELSRWYWSMFWKEVAPATWSRTKQRKQRNLPGTPPPHPPETRRSLAELPASRGSNGRRGEGSSSARTCRRSNTSVRVSFHPQVPHQDTFHTRRTRINKQHICEK